MKQECTLVVATMCVLSLDLMHEAIMSINNYMSNKVFMLNNIRLNNVSRKD